jgi:hypothetical protein
MKVKWREPIIQPGEEYNARIVEVKEGRERFGKVCWVSFEILDGESIGEGIRNLYNVKDDTSITPNSELGKVVNNLLTDDLKAGVEIDLERLVGRNCKITIEEKTTDKGVFLRVVDVKPMDETPAEGSSKEDTDFPF